MKTSRKDGILVFKTKKPYKIANEGKQVERNIIICRDINSKIEKYAYDLQQLFMNSFLEMREKSERIQDNSKKDDKENQKQIEEFYKNDCPPDKEIEKSAQSLKLMVNMCQSVRMSKYMDYFENIVFSEAIEVDGGFNMNALIWESIHYDDKLRLLFWYCAFFDNPLKRLSDTSILMEDQSFQGEVKENEKL